ncbi:MAG: ribonuclease R, partial [Polaromonas sp.]
YVEGLVHITELGGEYYRFDEARQELRGERSGMRYALGTRLRVQVSRVDLDGRKIDFRLVHEGEDKAGLVSRAMKDKAGGAAGELPLQDRVAGPRRGGHSERDAGNKSRQAQPDRASQPRARKSAAKKPAAGAGPKQGKKPRR